MEGDVAARPEDARVAKAFMASAMFWLVVAITLGLIQAIEFIAPDFAAGISWLVFPRIRQVHVNGLAFGWLSMAMIGGWYYIVPRLTRTKIYSERLAHGHRVAVERRARGRLRRTAGGVDAGARVRRAGVADRHRHPRPAAAHRVQHLHDHRPAAGEGPLRLAVVHHGLAHLVPDRLRDRQRGVGPAAGLDAPGISTTPGRSPA